MLVGCTGEDAEAVEGVADGGAVSGLQAGVDPLEDAIVPSDSSRLRSQGLEGREGAPGTVRGGAEQELAALLGEGGV